MAEIRGKYVYDGSLRPGQSEDGGLSQLLFDHDGKLADHAVFIPDEDGDDEGDQLVTDAVHADLSPEEVAQAIGLIIGVGAVAVAGVLRSPQVRRWWQDSVMPRFRKLTRGKTGQPADTEPLALTAAPADFARAVELAVDPVRSSMSRAEAEQRLVAALAAAAFVADQIRTLRNVRIEDDEMAELRRAMAMLTAQQVTDTVNRMLEHDSSFLDASTSAEFMRMFGGGREVEGEYLPIRNERIAEALRLVQGDADPGDDDSGRAFAPA